MIRRDLFTAEPRAMIMQATEMANVLSDVIEKQKLFTVIQSKKYVRVDAWATLGVMLGVLPRELEVRELANGDYEATVELYNTRTGAVVGRGSALCGIDEKRWGSADRYARRSMAITRATGKAYRLGFAWVMGLAGYESTPAEEIPEEGFPGPKESGADGSRQSSKSSRARQGETQASHKGGDGSVQSKPAETYNPYDPEHERRLLAQLEKQSIAKDLYPFIGEAMQGLPLTESSLSLAIKSAAKRAAQSSTVEVPFND